MPRKPPVTGITTVEVHTPTRSLSHGPATRPGNPPHIDFWPSSGLPARNPSAASRPTTGADLDAITPAPPRVTVNTITTPMPAPTVAQRPLTDYLITDLAQLPAADVGGLSTIKGRLYAKVSDNGTVQVGTDPDSGLYRARLASELRPSGPVLLHDPESKMWQTAERFPSSAEPLSTTRLQDFRTDLDFTDVEPDSDGLHRLNGKLYVSIESHAYQVLHDLDASTPLATVMRIIRPGDPVADDHGNIYVAMRPGRSEPIILDTQHGWAGTEVGGVGGMRRRGNPPDLFDLVDVGIQFDRLDAEIKKASATDDILRSAWQAAKGQPGEKKALTDRGLHHLQELSMYEKVIDYYTVNEAAIVALKGRDVYRKRLAHFLAGRILTYEQIIEVGFLRQALEGSIYDRPIEKLPAAADFLTRQLAILKKLPALEAVLAKKRGAAQPDADDPTLSLIEPHPTIALWVFVKSRLMTNDSAPYTNLQAMHLATSFGQVTIAYGAIDRIPATARTAVLSDLLDQCAAIRTVYGRLVLQTDSPHVSTRNDIISEIKAFEHTLEEHLSGYLREQVQNSALPAHEQPIDFDFIPAQDRSGPESRPWRIFRAKQHGIYKIRIGQTRRTAEGVEVIDVINPNEPSQSLQTYRQQDGHWQPLISTQAKNLPTLIREANQQLKQSAQVLKKALQDERDKITATNIIEDLESHAKALDDTALEVRQAPRPAADADNDALVQRLQQDSQRLRTEGEAIRVRLYKDKAYLSVDRVAYLISNGHINALKTQTRLERGKGANREFLDFYSLIDAQTREPLWHAHFHYARKDTADTDFNFRGGHLKTLEQSGRGSASQRRDEQAGLPHVGIWREQIDKQTARKIFDLAALPTLPVT